MAHFAEIDESGIVLRVLVVADADTATSTGEEVESIGADMLAAKYGGTFKQTSYNGNKRFNYAGIGYHFDETLNAFTSPQPYPSWSLDAECKWEAPTPEPPLADGERHSWDEDTLSWVTEPTEEG